MHNKTISSKHPYGINVKARDNLLVNQIERTYDKIITISTYHQTKTTRTPRTIIDHLVVSRRYWVTVANLVWDMAMLEWGLIKLRKEHYNDSFYKNNLGKSK
jgi:hypothetical protein